MSGKQNADVDIRPWSNDDLPLLERLRGDAAMNVHLGGPEPLEKIRARHERYRRSGNSGQIHMFAIVVGPGRVAAGSVGYWEREWRGQHVWETGWSVLPEFQGQGVATRVAAAVVERARADGVDAELEVWDGMWHVWHLLARYVPEGQQAVDKIGAFIRKHID